MNNFSSLNLCEGCTMHEVKDEKHCAKCKSDWNKPSLPGEFSPSGAQLQYLKEIRDLSARQLSLAKRASVINWVTFLAVLAIAVYLYFVVRRFVPVFSDLVNNVSSLVPKITELTNTLNTIDFSTLAQSSETVLKQSADGLVAIMQRVQEIDIASLNASIESLAKIIKPLSSFFGG